jgi:NADH-quinone oxidoreductase subunit M
MLLTIFIFPLLAAIGVFALGEKLAKFIALFASVILFGLTCVLFFNGVSTGNFGEVNFAWIPDMNIHFHLVADGLSVWLLLLTNFLVPIIILSSYHKSFRNANVFFAFVLFMQFGLNGVFLAADGFLYYIFWELALIPIFFIVWLWSDNEDLEVRKRTAFKFFVYTIAGSLFMLFGFMYLYAKLGSVSIEALYASSFSSNEQIGLFLCFFLAFAVKIPIFPFHTWQADTYREAPSVGTMLLSGIMLKMGIYSLIRWLIPLFPLGLAFWTPYIIMLCVIGIIYGAVIAIKQDNIKNLLAFSSLSHVGLIAAGTFVLSYEGMQGALIQMLAHGVNVVGLFFIAEIILQRTGTLSIAQLGGIRTVAHAFLHSLLFWCWPQWHYLLPMHL